MGVLAEIDRRFVELVDSTELNEAFEEWRLRQGGLLRFRQGPNELISFLRNQEESYQEKDASLWAMCQEAKAEAASNDDRSLRTASDFLIGLFSAALWRIFEEVRSANLAEPDDIAAEILLGFWETVHGKSDSRMLSSELVNSAKRRAWRAVADSASAAIPDEALSGSIDGSFRLLPESIDPWMLLRSAIKEGVINEIQAELVLWTRLNALSLERVAKALRLSVNAANLRRYRAERRLESWLDRKVDR